jgi:hypothetical protein
MLLFLKSPGSRVGKLVHLGNFLIISSPWILYQSHIPITYTSIPMLRESSNTRISQPQNAPIRSSGALPPIRENSIDHRWRIRYLMTFRFLSFPQTNLPRHRPVPRTTMPRCRRQSPRGRPPPNARSAGMVLSPAKINVPLSEMQRRRLGAIARSHHRIDHAVRERAGRVRTRCGYLRAALEQFLGRQ